MLIDNKLRKLYINSNKFDKTFLLSHRFSTFGPSSTTDRFVMPTLFLFFVLTLIYFEHTMVFELKSAVFELKSTVLAQQAVINNQLVLINKIDDKILMLNDNMLMVNDNISSTKSSLNTASLWIDCIMVVGLIAIAVIAIKTNVDIHYGINALASRNTEQGLALVNQIGGSNEIILKQVNRNAELICELQYKLEISTFENKMHLDSLFTPNIPNLESTGTFITAINGIDALANWSPLLS